MKEWKEKNTKYKRNNGAGAYCIIKASCSTNVFDIGGIIVHDGVAQNRHCTEPFIEHFIEKIP